MNAIYALAAIPQWVIGVLAAAGFAIWVSNYARAVKQDDIKMRIQSGFGMVFELLIIVLVVAYYIVR